MPVINVYHEKEPHFGMGPDTPFDAAHYELVAVVELPSAGDTTLLDATYALTNHIDRPWWENPEVTKVPSRKVRSTSVGDVIVLPGKRAFRVASSGFDKVNPRRRAWSGPGQSPRLSDIVTVSVIDRWDRYRIIESCPGSARLFRARVKAVGAAEKGRYAVQGLDRYGRVIADERGILRRAVANPHHARRG